MSHKADVSFPLARSGGLLVEHVGDETVVLDTETREAHCLSPLAAAVFAGADGRTRVGDLAAVAGSAIDEAVSVEQVDAALAQLDQRGLLDRPTLPADRPSGISRRSLVRRTAAATAAVSAAPMITSIVTPAFAQQYDARCPGALCASQSAGDDFCACNNECPCVEAGTCEPDDVQACAQVAETPPRLDSCECLNCDQLTDAGRADLCPPGPPFQQCPPNSSPQNPQPGGCTDPSKFLDGACLRIGGDSSEPCPEP